jgi:HEAT repeat protein
VTAPAITNQGRSTVAARTTTSIITAITNVVPELPFEVKPLPVLEKDYLTTTNRDTRLDVMMDIAETSSAETVKALTRLFEAETDPDLKVDLLDSLLGIEGFNDEKLIMLTMGARQGLPNEVRQSAIDGLIDLDDQRVIPVLNGLLNDPDEEIRESAKDALEMIQSQPAIKLQPK